MTRHFGDDVGRGKALLYNRQQNKVDGWFCGYFKTLGGSRLMSAPMIETPRQWAVGLPDAKSKQGKILRVDEGVEAGPGCEILAREPSENTTLRRINLGPEWHCDNAQLGRNGSFWQALEPVRTSRPGGCEPDGEETTVCSIQSRGEQTMQQNKAGTTDGEPETPDADGCNKSVVETGSKARAMKMVSVGGRREEEK